ncbi:MAG: DPP IV N-terminal domain-containing protein, partial [Trueperaceae bacterium]
LLLVFRAYNPMSSFYKPTLADYTRAEQLTPKHISQKLFGMSVTPHWLPDGFWYRNKTPTGHEFIRVRVANTTREPAFDHVRLAQALHTASGQVCDPLFLPFETITLNGSSLTFSAFAATWQVQLPSYTCEQLTKDISEDDAQNVSPDGNTCLIFRGDNLWVRDKKTNVEKQLTFDGSPEQPYAQLTINYQGGEQDTGTPDVAWSPDSSKLFTYQIDLRGVPKSYLLASTPEGVNPHQREQLHSYQSPLYDEARVITAKLCVIDVVTGQTIDIQTEPLICLDMEPSERGFGRMWWSEQGDKVYFIRRSHYYRDAWLYEANPSTGQTRILVHETWTKPLDLSADRWPVSIDVIDETNEVIWYDERSDWGHLYLYDGHTGKLKRAITSGSWLVRQLCCIDKKNRSVYFVASGKESGDPYFRYLYRASLDHNDIALLTPENADHDVVISPNRDCFIDTYSQVNTNPVTMLRSIKGEILQTLEQADLRFLRNLDWQRPEPFTLKARDNKTDIYGVLFFPSHFDPKQRYPLLDFTYPGPHQIQTPKRLGIYGDGQDDMSEELDWIFWYAQAMAELGFVVMTLDGMGTAYRSRSFKDVAYGENFGEAGGLTDHVVAMKELAKTRPYLDLEAVGIWGSSGGGYAAARAMLLFPEFFKVAVAQSGNHNQWRYGQMSGERNIGEPTQEKYRLQANSTYAHQLEGKLLLIHGELDNDVHPAHTLELVDTLIKADKDFDLLLVPNEGHALSDLPYIQRKLWDYFVEHLLGAAPPKRNLGNRET